MHPARSRKKKEPSRKKLAPKSRLVRTLDAVTSLRSAMVLVVGVLILCAFTIREASTKELGPEAGPETAAVETARETGEAEALIIQDPAVTIIESVVERKFEQRGDVVMERLRADFERVAAHLELVDLSQMKPLRRGKDWVIVTVPTRRAESEPGEPEDTTPPTLYQLRLVCHENTWKLDRMKKLEANES